MVSIVKINMQEVEVAQKNLQGFIERINEIGLIENLHKEKKLLKNKDFIISSCIWEGSRLFEKIVNEDNDQIKVGLSSLVLNILLYCDSFKVKIKDVAKYCEYEQLQYLHIELQPASFMVYIFKEILDIKFNYWAAHHAGEALGKCFVIARHYKINLWQQIDIHISQLKNK